MEASVASPIEWDPVAVKTWKYGKRYRLSFFRLFYRSAKLPAPKNCVAARSVV